MAAQGANGEQPDSEPMPTAEESKETGASELDQKDQLVKWHCKYNPMKKFVCTFGEREPTDAEMFIDPDNSVLPETTGLPLPETDQGDDEDSEGDSSEGEDSQSTVTDSSSEEGLPEMRGLPEDDVTSQETEPEAGEADGESEVDSDTDE